MEPRAGAVSVSLAFFLTTAAAFGLGCMGLLRLERAAQTLQLQLLDCTAVRAKRLKSLQNQIESLNQKLDAARKAIALASVLTPEAQLPLRQLAQGIATTQDLQLKSYTLQTRLWRLSNECKALPILATSEGDLEPHWMRPPPDAIGPLLLVLPDAHANRYQLTLQAHRFGISRRAKAQVFHRNTWEGSSEKWAAQWLPRTSTHRPITH